MHPIQALSPLIACALIWVGSRAAYSVLAGLVAVGVYPYIAVGSVDKENGDAGWLAFRHAIPEWGQFWHRSCGRVYETEGPGSQNFVSVVCLMVITPFRMQSGRRRCCRITASLLSLPSPGAIML